MVFDFLKRKAPEAKASATAAVIAYGSTGRVAWTPRDTVSLTRNGFAGNPVGFRSVKLIAEAAAALPLVVQNAERRFDVHPLIGLIERPNAGQGRAELFEALYAQLLLSGNAYVEAVGAGDGLPVELHVLRSDRISVVPGAILPIAVAELPQTAHRTYLGRRLSGSLRPLAAAPPTVHRSCWPMNSKLHSLRMVHIRGGQGKPAPARRPRCCRYRFCVHKQASGAVLIQKLSFASPILQGEALRSREPMGGSEWIQRRPARKFSGPWRRTSILPRWI